MVWATGALQWILQKEAIRSLEANPEKYPKFGLYSATRVYEVGIASNRKSASYGEYLTKFCTYCPSSYESEGNFKIRIRGYNKSQPLGCLYSFLF